MQGPDVFSSNSRVHTNTNTVEWFIFFLGEWRQELLDAGPYVIKLVNFCNEFVAYIIKHAFTG